jgi:hypothetical protein
VRDLAKFLQLFAEPNTGAKLLFKEQQALHLQCIVKKSRAEHDILRRIHGGPPAKRVDIGVGNNQSG